MAWYAVRSVYEHDQGLFGERVVLIEAENSDELLEKAEREWASLASSNPTFKRLGNFTAFTVSDSERPSNGTEIRCMLFESAMPAGQFLKQRYEELEPKPDETGV